MAAQQNYALGTVGWGKDSSYYDIGSADADKTLIKVTLVWGRNPTESLNGAGAQGARILATLPGPIYQMPGLGDLVELGIPQGMERMPGAATIRGWHKPSPSGFDADTAVWVVKSLHLDASTKVRIGDGSAAALAHSAQVLNALNDIIVLLTAINVWLNGTIVLVGGTFTDPGAGLTNTLVTAVTTALTDISLQLSQLPTKKLDAT